MLHNTDTTHAEILLEFVESVKTLLDNIDYKNQYLRLEKQDERTQAHYTHKLIQQWLNNRAYLKL